MTTLPQPKLPSWNTPNVRSVPTIPNVGCVAGNATTVVGQQFGNFPDAQALPHVKGLQKMLTEQIGTLIEGKLPDAARSPLYQIRQLRLVQEMAQMVATAASIATQIQSETNAAIDGCNEKIADINSSKNVILQTPANLRSVLQQKTLDRYDEYIGEINGQISRLQTALGCLN